MMTKQGIWSGTIAGAVLAVMVTLVTACGLAAVGNNSPSYVTVGNQTTSTLLAVAGGY